MRQKWAVPITLSLALVLGSCTSLAQFAATTAQTLSSNTPAQVRTLAEAIQAATLITNAVDVYVNTGNPSKATLLELQVLNNNVHDTLERLRMANADGQSLAVASFNEALAAFIAYATMKGVQH